MAETCPHCGANQNARAKPHRLGPRVEAERLVRVFNGQVPQLMQLLSGQFGVLKTHAQMLLGLSGLTVTVTGFSGAHMIRGGAVSAACMVVGIVFIAVAVVLTLQVLRRLRFVSQDLQDDLVATTCIVLERRNLQQRRVGWAGIFVGLGLVSYLSAVAIAAWVNSGIAG